MRTKDHRRRTLAIVLAALSIFALGLLIGSATTAAKARCADAEPLFSPGSEKEFVSLMANAREGISVEMYQFSYSPLADALKAAASRGARVRVIFDRTVTDNYAMARDLAAAGVLVRFAPQKFSRLHAKFAIVDDEKVLVGSTNWSFHAMFLNREAAVILKDGSSIEEFSSVFESDWEESDAFIA